MINKKILRSVFDRLPIKLRCIIQDKFLGGKVVIGRGSYIHPSVHLLGKANIQIGDNSCISEGTWLNVNHRGVNAISIDIKGNCFIGKQNFFSSGALILIKDYTLTAIGCKFIGSSHRINDPRLPYLTAGTYDQDQIEVGVNCFFGAGSTVLGNVKIGHGSIIGANSLVIQDVPPFSVVVGSPAVVVKRYDFFKDRWLQASHFSCEEGFGMPCELEYLEQLKNKFPRLRMPWIAAGKSMGDC
jgi:acetyltransferase-like isoleucine patch superfamily enzyme